MGFSVLRPAQPISTKSDSTTANIILFIPDMLSQPRCYGCRTKDEYHGVTHRIVLLSSLGVCGTGDFINGVSPGALRFPNDCKTSGHPRAKLNPGHII